MMAHLDRDSLTTLTRFTLPQVLWRQSQNLGPENTALREKACGVWDSFTWAKYLQHTKRVALGLTALGVRRGEAIVTLLGNQTEWLFSTLGAQAIGCVTLSLPAGPITRATLQALAAAQPAMIFVASHHELNPLLPFRKDLPSLRRIIYVDPTATRQYWDDPGLIRFSEVLDLGEELDTEQPDLFIKELWEGQPDEPARLALSVEGSKSFRLTRYSHLNLTNLVCQWLASFPLQPAANWVSFAPTISATEQMWCFGIALCAGMVVNFPETPERAWMDLRELLPEAVAADPSFWEELTARIAMGAHHSGPILKRLHRLAFSIRGRSRDLQDLGRPFPWGLRGLQVLLEAVLSAPLRRAFGLSRCRIALSAGRPISSRTLRALEAYGIRLLHSQAYAESGEILPPATADLRPNDSRLHERTLAHDRSFSGYLKRPQINPCGLDLRPQRAEALAVRPVGRSCCEHGKGLQTPTPPSEQNGFGPLEMAEASLRSSIFIKDAAILFSEDSRITAAVALDAHRLEQWFPGKLFFHGRWAEMLQDPDVHSTLRSEIAAINQELPPGQHIASLVLCDRSLFARFPLCPSPRRREVIRESCGSFLQTHARRAANGGDDYPLEYGEYPIEKTNDREFAVFYTE